MMKPLHPFIVGTVTATISLAISLPLIMFEFHLKDFLPVLLVTVGIYSIIHLSVAIPYYHQHKFDAYFDSRGKETKRE